MQEIKCALKYVLYKIQYYDNGVKLNQSKYYNFFVALCYDLVKTFEALTTNNFKTLYEESNSELE